MIYPVGARRNARYRGPMESTKLNYNMNELRTNIDKLREVFDTQEVKLTDIKNKIEDKPIKQSRFRVKKMTDAINQINGGI